MGLTTVHPAVLLADTLLERGAIGRVRTVRGETTYQADPDALFRGWPIVVLVDSSTGGTAQWLAAALQDNHRATVVGPAIGPHEPHVQPLDAISRSTIPVGDGAWSVSLVTGYLERGDGRPLADRDRALVGALPRRETVQSRLQPDHVVPAGGRPGQRGAGQAGAPNPAADPVIQSAVTILHQAMQKI
jgi:hypothetical protein